MNTTNHTQQEILPHQLTKNVKLLQKVGLNYRGKILILRRSKDAKSRSDKWDLPGGNSEWPVGNASGFGHFAQDAVREITEETGLIISPSKFTPNRIVYFDTFYHAQSDVFSILVGWAVSLPEDPVPPQIEVSAEHGEFHWITKNEIAEYDFGGQKGAFVQKIIENAFQKNT